jgi:glycosyltransferase involved in cell wall biosynthesis
MRFSVIVPTYNRRDLLRRCLATVVDQDYADYDVIVIDDASTDGSGEMIRHEFPRVHYICQPEHQGQFIARNRGIKASDGDLLAFADDDCVYPRGWLAAHAKYYGDSRIGAVGAQKGPLVPDFYYKFHAAQYSDQYRAVQRVERITARQQNLRTGSMSIARRAIERVGGFDEQFVKGSTEDLVRRISSAGYHFVCDPALYVEHTQTFTLWTFLADRFREASGQIMTDVKEDTVRARRFVPLLNVGRTWNVWRNFHKMFGGSIRIFAAFWGLAILTRWAEVAGRAYFYWTDGRNYRRPA